MSQQRAQAAKLDRLAFDPKLIEDLEKVKVDPRPDTSRIFKVDYFRMSDLAVDNLMAYYYDTIALYGEVERFVKKSKADKESLTAFAAKQARRAAPNTAWCSPAAARSWSPTWSRCASPCARAAAPIARWISSKASRSGPTPAPTGAPGRWVPSPTARSWCRSSRTPLLESVMAGSPDQARMEQYRIRYANIQLLLARLAQTQKQLKDALDTAAKRPDIFQI